MSITRYRDIGDLIFAEEALRPNIVIEGTTTTGTVTLGIGKKADGAAQTGLVIDRLGFKNKSMPLSCKVMVHSLFETQATALDGQDAKETATVAARLQDSTATGGTFANHGSTSQSLSVGDTTTGSGVFDGLLQFDVDLSGANRFVRLNVTPTISTSTTSTGAVANHMFTAGQIVFGGFDQNPTTATTTG